MPTSTNTHDYDGKLREKWFQMRPMLLEKYLPNCLSFNDTIKQIEKWFEKKYINSKRIGRARRSIRILTSQRSSNFDSRNEIDVEELLPILWDKVKNQDDIHDIFFEQLCDITGGSCSQGRSTRLFQFLFLFDLPADISNTGEKTELSTEEKVVNKDLVETTDDDNNSHSTSEDKTEISTDEESVNKDLSEMTIDDNSRSTSEEKRQPEEKSPEEQQSQEKSKSSEEQTSEEEQQPDHVEQTNSSSIKIE